MNWAGLLHHQQSCWTETEMYFWHNLENLNGIIFVEKGCRLSFSEPCQDSRINLGATMLTV